jgi:hypothetical protein
MRALQAQNKKCVFQLLDLMRRGRRGGRKALLAPLYALPVRIAGLCSLKILWAKRKQHFFFRPQTPGDKAIVKIIFWVVGKSLSTNSYISYL